MTFAKCLHLNRSIRGMNRPTGEMMLAVNERVPVYRRQVGAVFSVEYSGESRFSYEERRGGQRRPALSFLF